MGIPINPVTGCTYNGRHNGTLLAMTRSESMQFAGFNQWLTVGRCVKKGEKGTRIWLAPMEKKVQREDGSSESVRIRCKGSVVFALEQTEQVTPEQVSAIISRKNKNREPEQATT